MSKVQRYQPPGVPSRLSRLRDAVRSYWLGPILSSDPQASSFFFGGQNTQAGIQVNEFTAMNYSAVFAATNAISGDIASFPLMMYKRLPDGGKDRFDANPLYRMVHDTPNPEMTSVIWRRTMQAHALTWGNGYSEIQRDVSGRAIALWPITPDRVTPFRRSADAPLQYRVVNRDGSDEFIDAPDMIHVPGLSFDGVRGYSVIAKARESFGLGMAAEQFGNTFFGNGATFGGVIAYPGAKPPELSEKNYRDSLNAQHQGVGNAHKFLALYNGAKYDRLGIPPNDAQFLETRQFQIGEVARWFNLPPHKLGDLQRSTHSNIEQQTIDYYTGTLLPWLKIWEQELLVKLIPRLESRIQFFEHVVEGLLRGDTAARGEFHSKQFNTAAITPNEIRESENRNPLKGGDRGFVPLNMIPLDRVDEWIDAEIAAKKPKPTPPAPVLPPAGPDPTQIKALEDDLNIARKLAQDAEEAKDHAVVQFTAAEQARDAALSEVETLRAMTEGLSLDVVTAQRSLDEERDAHADTTTQHETALKDVARVTAQHLEAQTALTEARRAHEADLVAARATIEQVTTSLTAAIAVQDDLRQADEVAQAVIGELRAQVLTLSTDVAAGVVAITDAREAVGRAHTERDAALAAKGDAVTTAEAMTSAAANVTATLTTTRQALRGVLVDAVSRLVARESDRARKAQSSPEKLAKWAETFYPMHEDVCRTVLRPAVKAWLVASGTDLSVDHLLDRVVPSFIAESTRQLRGLSADTNMESLAPALERVLRRWETERPEALVDRITREAV